MIVLSSGKTAGIVVEIDFFETTIICYSHQRLMFPSLKTHAGYKVCTNMLRNLLLRKGISKGALQDSLLLEVLREMGLKVVTCPNQSLKIDSVALGCEIPFEVSDYWQCMNALFYNLLISKTGISSSHDSVPVSNPHVEITNCNENTLSENIVESFWATHSEEWASMIRNLVVAGPGSSLPGIL